MSLDLQKPAHEILVDLVNRSQDKDYVYSAVVFDNLEIMPYDHARNSGIRMSAVEGQTTPEEPVNLYYNRLPFQRLVDYRYNADFVPTLEDEGYLLKSDLLTQINSLYQINLTVDDIVEGPLPEGGSYPKNIIIQINPANIIYTGLISLMLVDQAQT